MARKSGTGCAGLIGLCVIATILVLGYQALDRATGGQAVAVIVGVTVGAAVLAAIIWAIIAHRRKPDFPPLPDTPLLAHPLQAQRAAEVVEVEDDSDDEEDPDEDDHFLTKVAGTSRRQHVAQTLRAGDRLTLRRDPSNQADPNAVMVLTPAGLQVGFLYRGRAAQICEQMDAGARYRCTVLNVTGHNHGTLGVNIEVERIG